MSGAMADRVAPDAVRTVACVGAGVIGGGWVAYFLARGFAVRAWDPAPDAEARLRERVDADVVQESAPEQLELKRGLLAAVDAATPAHIVVASSTSGFGMTEMATEARTPE